ncbi:MAG: hypothetical protein PHQ75_10420, partial [Thermoguttaceae bacterium]|nr:hypothetical protein [Thermoguttaceae bacterium]
MKHAKTFYLICRNFAAIVLFFSMSLFSAFCMLFASFLSETCVLGVTGQPANDSAAFEQRLLTDWIYQDYGLDWQQCFRSGQESSIEQKLLAKVLDSLPEEQAKTLRQSVAVLVKDNVPGNDSRWLALYRQACQKRRLIRLETVLDECPQIVYTKHFVLGASFYSYTDDTTDEQHHDYSRDRRPGAALCKMTVKPDGSVVHETLLETKDGMIRDPEVSWDGNRILFSMRKHLEKDDFHLYDYNIQTKQVRQLTFGPGFADTEPVYLPDGNILFSSTRCMQVIDCWWTEATNFYMCDRDGRFMRRVSFDQVSVNYPKVLSDGRVSYTRWDYNDRGQVFPQPLFVMNADATGQTEFYGNNSYFPTSILHARGVPGSHKVVAIASGHHTHQHGKLIMIDRTRGTQETQGVTFVSPIKQAEQVKIDTFGQDGEQFQYPYPLSDSEWLVTYLPEGRQKLKGGRLGGYNIPFGIYVMDIDGNRELLAWDGSISCNQQIPLVGRTIPPLRASQVDETKNTGRFYVHNVYEGPGLKGVPKGTIKSLRVVTFEVRCAGVGDNRNHGCGGSALISTPVSINNGSWDVKRVLGTVPVEKDGSAFFEVPSQIPVYFQLLDAQEDVVQTMRSWSTLQPGEFFACIGCHEGKENTMINLSSATSIALSKRPAKPNPPFKPAAGVLQNAGFSFVRDVQPILDTHCVSCHTGGTQPDGSAAPFSLLGNEYVYVPPQPDKANPNAKLPPVPSWVKSGRRFSQAYMNLTNFGDREHARSVFWLDVQSGPPMLPPYTAGAFKSPLVQLFRNPERDAHHKDVKLSAAESRVLALWIDLLVPFCGDYREENNWTERQSAEYAYYEQKKDEMSALVQENVKQKIQVDRGQAPLPDIASLRHFAQGGPEAKGKFIDEYLKRQLPRRTQKSGSENVYRNLALNPNDTQDAPTAWPHASTNSEYARMDCFAAKNVLDGRTENKGHGPKFPSWGPNKRTDLWLKVDFGHKVKTDKVVLFLRADFPHDGFWHEATLEFSDGSKQVITLRQTD